jgi:hypothetical protein
MKTKFQKREYLEARELEVGYQVYIKRYKKYYEVSEAAVGKNGMVIFVFGEGKTYRGFEVIEPTEIFKVKRPLPS